MRGSRVRPHSWRSPSRAGTKYSTATSKELLCAQACGRAVKEQGGSIINISSIHEDHTFPGFTPYCAAKGGMRMMMRNAALELSQYRIRVNNIAPGAIATPINEPTLHDSKKMAELGRGSSFRSFPRSSCACPRPIRGGRA